MTTIQWKNVSLTLLGLLTLIVVGCKQEELTDRTPLSGGKSSQLGSEELFFQYGGTDSLVHSVISQVRVIQDSADIVSRFVERGATPKWNDAIRVGVPGDVETLYVPVVYAGLKEILWVWRISTHPRIGTWSEFLTPESVPKEDRWIFDYFTQFTLKEKPKSGLSFTRTPENELRGFYKREDDGLYYCVNTYAGAEIPRRERSASISTPRLLDYKGTKCFLVPGPPSLGPGPRRPDAPPPGPGVTGPPPFCRFPTFPPLPPVPPTSPPAPIDPPVPPCDQMTLKMGGDLGDKIQDLTNYLNADPTDNRRERGYAEMTDGSFKKLEKDGVGKQGQNNLDFGEVDQRNVRGIIHTHGDPDGVTAEYITRGFSPQDIQQFVVLMRNALVRASRLPESSTYDLSQCYLGVVTRSGVYYLQGKGRITPSEAFKLLGKLNASPKNPSPSDLSEEYDTYVRHLREARREDKNLIDFEQNYVLNRMRNTYPDLGSNFSLFLFAQSQNEKWFGRMIILNPLAHLGNSLPRTTAKDC